MTVRDSITRTGARTPGAEDYPTSMAAHGRASHPTQCGITEVASMCARGRHKPNISRCMPGAGLSRPCAGRCCPTCQPSSRIGENPPYGMIGRVEETSASFEARSAPRLYPTEAERDRVALIGRWHATPPHVLLALQQQPAVGLIFVADAHKIGLQGVAVRQLEAALQRVLHILPQLGAAVGGAAARLACFINGWRL